MADADPDLSSLPQRLLAHLKGELGRPDLDYAVEPSRLMGGQETYTYRFAIEGAPDDLAHPLVLRLYRGADRAHSALVESTVQTVLADAGYPAARARLVCTDAAVLGAPFFVMDLLPGQTMAAAPRGDPPAVLGRAHATLHALDPESLIHALAERGVEPAEYSLSRRMEWLAERGKALTWLREATEWLLENRPPEPLQPSICHGDFHFLNVLFEDGAVSGVLDWPGFTVTDPAFDVANTMVITTVPSKLLAAQDHRFAAIDWDEVAGRYLEAYCARRPLDLTRLPYYRARRCISALQQGADGQRIWQHPAIVQDLVGYIHATTGLWVKIPD